MKTRKANPVKTKATRKPAAKVATRTRKPAGTKKSRPIKASFDSAQVGNENDNHWTAADSFDANTAGDVATRTTIRDRSRYESDNNSYYRGLLDTMADDLIGTTPRLALTIPGDDEEGTKANAIESAFSKWSMSVSLSEKLRIMDRARRRDGETFAVMISNPRVTERGLTNVQLDLKIYEAEQVSDPNDYGLDPLYVDGIRYDDAGNVESYTFLKHHPGSYFGYLHEDKEVIEASNVIHWYKPTRPGQYRGIPEMQAALPLFAQLRRFTLATLTAAETAAMIAGILKSTLPSPNAEQSAQSYNSSKFDAIPLKRGTLLTLPPDCDASQFKPEQPTSTYKEFKGELLNEIGRCVGVPFNVIAGNSSGYNYSSGRLDHTIYHRGIKVERYRLRQRVLDPLFVAWIEEASLVGDIPDRLPSISEWSWTWQFDGFATIDPLKEANARAVDLASGSTNFAIIYGEQGLDWEEQLAQRAREQRKIAALGLVQNELPKTIPDAIPAEEGVAA